MNKGMTKAMALAMAAALTMTACGSSNTTGDNTSTPSTPSAPSTTPSTPSTTPAAPSQNTDSDKYQIDDLVFARNATRELETFNVLYSQRQEDTENLSSVWDGLLEVDNSGKLQPCLAESWETTDNGLTWTFKLREGLKWVDVNGEVKADNNAYDFATGLEWVLNYHKNAAANTSMPIEMIKGASEYYEYTRTLSEEEAYALTAGEGSKFAEMVGCKTPDANTVVYECITEKPYFDTLAPYVCLYPISQALVDELGVAGIKSMDNTSMWYNGAYLMTDYIQGNSKYYEQNPHYWDTNCHRFNSVTIIMAESSDVMYQLYQNGEIDYVGLSEAQVQTIMNDPNHQFHDNVVNDIPSKYSYQFHWNYNKNDEDPTVVDTNWNTAIANNDFRASLYYGIDLSAYFKRYNLLDPLSCENNFYTMPGLVYTSDGTDYTELVKERLGLGDYNGSTMVRFDLAKAEEHKAKAIEALTALGVTFPVEMDYYIAAANQTALDSANVLKDAIEASLGSDYVTMKICTYVSSLNKEVRDPRLQSFLINGWGADYGDPMNYLGQETYGEDNAWYSVSYSNINTVEETEATKQLLADYKEYTELVSKANAINDDLDARYNAFADAEAFLIQHNLTTPSYLGKSLCLTKINIHSKQNAMFGSYNDKMKNWETKKADSYTVDEISAFLAAK